MKQIAVLLCLCVFSQQIYCMETSVVEPEASVGKPMLDFTLETLVGKKVALSYIKRDYPVMLVFFTIWSGQCKKSVIELNQFRREWEKRGLVVIGVSTDKDRIFLSQFVRAHHLKIPIFRDVHKNATKKYTIGIVPTNILINRKGIIVYRGHQLPEEKYVIEALSQ